MASTDREWSAAPAPLRTRWSRRVSPENARPEYPRPHAVRRDWMSLNGRWEFAFGENAGDSRTPPPAFPHEILVPWTYEASLSGIGLGEQIHESVWYRRRFDVRESWRGRRIVLHFGAVDWECEVWVNGHRMGEHRGGYAPFRFDITDALLPGASQEIVVRVFDPADPKRNGWQPRGKQLGSEGIWYTRTTGIWQSVWIEPLNACHIADFALEADMDGRLAVRASCRCDRGETLDIVVSRGRQEVASARLRGDLTQMNVALRVPEPDLWSPESPALYRVTLTLRDGRTVLDQVRSYTAFRSIGIADGRITLNGQPYLLKAVLDQGFWPDGIYTPPTDSAIRYDVEMTKAFGFNMARKHVKVEDPRWYYWCDRLGLLVAQDMPSSHNLSVPEARANFAAEWREVVDAVRGYPSVVLWIPFNENWGDPGAYQDEIVDLTRALDPSRPIIDASGWTQRDKTDITDIHDYGNELAKYAVMAPDRPRWIGEYGGVALPVRGHTWIKGWGYQSVTTPDALERKYADLTGQINGAPGLSGFCYTQLTDVEQEVNGLMTYDRLPKVAPEVLQRINADSAGAAPAAVTPPAQTVA